MSTDHHYNRERIRVLLRQCDYLDRAKAVSPHGKWVIGFAIKWAPFGGASASELLETFGVTPTRFRQLLHESLDPRGAADHRIRALMSELSDALMGAWTRPA
ncbi:hypothetical protein GCM10023094_12070 [Rhodococcus olei]|uniref:Uncharacterized protein n=1 Tax=Rhodococcus olei TaxID=2161675 RepID=A0ABP8NYJ7_9NOCA